jgi:leucyl-tRNA synthetase
MILGENGEKMSKSRGNVINPDDIINEYGADTMRLYEMFIGDFEKAAPWSTSSIKGCKRFLDRVWALKDNVVEADAYRAEVESEVHKMIRKVTDDIETLKMNTAIASMMAFINTVGNTIGKAEYKTLLILLNPFAPHITEEIWEEMGFEGRLNQAKWPEYDEAKCVEATVEIVIQVNGKLKGRMNIPADITAEDAIALAKEQDSVKTQLEGKTVVKELYVPKKLVNIVVK